MKLSLNNFLSQIKNIVTGDAGIATDNFRPAESLGLGGSATRVATSNSQPLDAVSLAAANQHALLTLRIPRDYDEFSDKLILTFVARLESGTSADLHITAASKVVVEGTVAAPAALTGFVAPALQTLTLSTPVKLAVDLTGKGFKRGDIVTVKLNCDAVVGVGIAHVLGANVHYNSTIVSYNEEDSTKALLR